MDMKNVIFYGNGISRFSANCPEWNDLLKNICHDRISFLDDDNIPPTFKYEMLLPDEENSFYTITNRDKTIMGGNEIIGTTQHNEHYSKRQICNKLKQISPNPFYQRLAKLKVYDYITTNYDYLLEDTFKTLYNIDITSECLEKIYSVTRKNRIKLDNRYVNIWHMHGEIDDPASVMLGLDQYVGILSRIEQYVKGYKIYHNQRPQHIIEKIKNNSWGIQRTWVDYFFKDNIHIIGFGLDYSETDLWWLLNKRKRLYKKLDKKPLNTITFYGELPDHKEYLLKRFDVEYVKFPVENKDYHSQCCTILDEIEKLLGTRN